MPNEQGIIQQNMNILPFNSFLSDNIYLFLAGKPEKADKMLRRAEYFRLAPGGRLIACKSNNIVNALESGAYSLYLDVQFGERKQQNGGSKKRAIGSVSFFPEVFDNLSTGIEIREIQSIPFSKERGEMNRYLPINHKDFFIHLVEQVGLLLYQSGINIAHISMAPKGAWDIAAAIKHIQKKLGKRVYYPESGLNSPDVDKQIMAELQQIQTARKQLLFKNGYTKPVFTKEGHHFLLAKAIDTVPTDNRLNRRLRELDWINALIHDVVLQIEGLNSIY